ncbi:PilW family protein [Aromatoleum bremense]|uniref:Prepilin-type N-terminal cleavage/methylation domain-containing protein n=1 Tax=Aromatoleum bremense TaxID=76115 RepID=A0ABX1NSH2_9RHOO|nr:prepilin-type N-terminal cleavage/methylation domain-containing protein [Aromatoleum bremense]NMG14647.1 hypothetical protein [Aromatoleum bremense]QTQ30507.1 Uncharacterized protein pbN1_05150 [Aromatoleum bremense]
MLSRSRQAGLSLVELMVGLVVGLIVVAGAGAMYVTTVRGQSYGLRAAKLNQDLRATMSVIAADIRRAGYWAGSVVVNAGPPVTYTFPTNPYTAATTDLAILEGGTCVMYAYDADGLGGAVEPGEVFGFRLTGDEIQMLQTDSVGGPTLSSDCTVGNWSGMTSNDTVVIDSLSFSTTGSQCMYPKEDISWKLETAGSTVAACAAAAADVTMNNGGTYVAPVAGEVLTEVRQVTITLTGHHASDSVMASTITETVHLANNRIFNW